MKLEEQVCSVEYAQRLKEVGIHQVSLFYWQYFLGHNFIILDAATAATYTTETYSAFSVGEIGELLRVFIRNRQLAILKEYSYHENNYYWSVTYIDTSQDLRLQSQFKRFCEENMANALAKMLIYLLENNRMKLPE